MVLSVAALLLLTGESWIVLDVTGQVVARENARDLRSPGSAVKPFTAVAMIDAGIGSMRVICSRKLRIGSRQFDCAHPVFGQIDLATAIAFSCNRFFAEGAKRLPAGAWDATLRRFGLAAKTASTDDERQWAAAGGWGIECSAEQLAEAYRRLAGLAGYEALRAGLRSGVDVGTGQQARVREIVIAGKTGTAAHHGWFAGWAPAEKPKIVVVVLAEPGTGPADAAPRARELFKKYAH